MIFQKNLFIVIVCPFEDNFIISLKYKACLSNHRWIVFQHLKLHAHVSLVFVLSPSSQCQAIGLGGGGGEHIYIYFFFCYFIETYVSCSFAEFSVRFDALSFERIQGHETV